MRKKALVFASLFMANSHAFACALPKEGPLIPITGPHEDGYYKAAIPRKLDGSTQEPEIRLHFAEDQAEARATLQPLYSVGKEKIVINIPAQELENRSAYLRVFWPPHSPGMCGVFAESRSFGSPAD